MSSFKKIEVISIKIKEKWRIDLKLKGKIIIYYYLPKVSLKREKINHQIILTVDAKASLA